MCRTVPGACLHPPCPRRPHFAQLLFDHRMRLAKASRILLEDDGDDPERGKTLGTTVSRFPDEGRGGLEASTPSRDLGRLSKGRKKEEKKVSQRIRRILRLLPAPPLFLFSSCIFL